MSSFSGKAANEAKQYFSELHGTILESFKGLFDDLEENLQQHLDTFESDVDVSESAVIKSDYLQEVKEEVNEVFEDLVKQDEIIHDTIQDVSDITSASTPIFSDVDEWKGKADKKIKELDENLETFSGESDETDVKAVMKQIEEAMNNAKASEGKARFADFEGASEMKELEKLQGYNKTKKKERNKKAIKLADKLADGKMLNYEEREMLYQYIQKEELSEEDDKRMDEIASKMGKEEFNEYINEDVLYSEASLNEEISRLEKYLYEGNERPDDLRVTGNERIKLRSYLDVLHNYQTAINEVDKELDWDRSEEDPLLARSEYVDFSEEKEPFHFLTEGEITIAYEQEINEDKEINRESFLNAPIQGGRVNKSSIEYYTGSNAAKDLKEKHKLEDEDEIDAANGQFVAEQILGSVLNAPAGFAKDLAGNRSDKADAEERVRYEELEQTADDYNLELQVNRRDVPGSTTNMEVAFRPTAQSHDVIERWQEYDDFPSKDTHPKELLEKQDWEGLNKFTLEHEEDMKKDENTRQVQNYIFDGGEEPSEE